MVVIKGDNRKDSTFLGADGNVGAVDIRTARSEMSEVPKADKQVLRKLPRT